MRMLVYGFLLGIFVPVVGMIVYLQVSTFMGDILLMPMYLFSGIYDEPFWYLALGEKVTLFVMCGVFYSFFIGLIGVSPNLSD